jgi:N-acetylneuraminate lyase
VTSPIQGILPAAITPLDDAGQFVAKTFERLLDRLYGAGVDGVYVCGTTGEGTLLSRQQRQAIVETAVACTPPDRKVVVHVAAASLSEAIALAAHAARAGAHAVSSLPPTSSPFGFHDVFRYYQALAQASELPLLVYYFPEVSQAIATTDQLAAVCELPNVCGLKFTDFDLYRMASMGRPGRGVFNGRDEVLAAGLLMGATGGIGTFYNVTPELFVEIYRAAAAGRWEEARAAQRRVNTLIKIVLGHPLFPAIKQMLAWSGLDCGVCLPPRSRLEPAQQTALRTGLAAAGFDDLVRFAPAE